MGDKNKHEMYFYHSFKSEAEFAIFSAQRRVVLKSLANCIHSGFYSIGTALMTIKSISFTHLTRCLKEVSISERGAKAKNVIAFGMFGNRLHNGAIDDD